MLFVGKDQIRLKSNKTPDLGTIPNAPLLLPNESDTQIYNDGYRYSRLYSDGLGIHCSQYTVDFHDEHKVTKPIVSLAINYIRYLTHLTHSGVVLVNNLMCDIIY